MKLKANTSNSESQQVKEESDTSSSTRSSGKRKSKLSVDHKYRVIQCTGYLKSWTQIKEDDVSSGGGSESEDQITNLYCLVAIGKVPANVLESNQPASLDNNPNIRHVVFISRHSVDGKFLFIEQRYVKFCI